MSTRRLPEEGTASVPPYAIAFVLGLALLVYCPAIAGVPFYTKGEPREAIVVQAILDQHAWILPLRNGNEIPSKPPLFHWLGAAASILAGRIDETTVRLPSVLASLAAVVLTARAGAWAFGPTAGWLAGAVLATAAQWVASSTTARVDMTLTAALTWAFIAAWRALETGPGRLPATFFLASAAAVLAKGPVGIALPVVVLACYLLLGPSRAAASLFTPRLPALFWLVPIAWYGAAAYLGGRPFIDKLIFKENVYRVLDPNAVGAGHVHSALYYVPALAAGVAPWSLVLPWVAWDLWRERKELNRCRYPIVWGVATLAFFAVAGSKRGVYLLPAYPAFALLTGRWLALRLARPSSKTARRLWLPAAAMVVPALMGLLLATGVPVGPMVEPFLSRSDAANFAALQSALSGAGTLCGLWLAVACLLAATSRQLAQRKRLAAAVGCTIAAVAITEAGIAATIHRQLAETQSAAPLYRRVGAQMPSGERLYFYGGFDYAAVFYTRHVVEPVHSLDEIRPARGAWVFLQAPLFERLRHEIARNGLGLRPEVKGRFDYHGNPRRAPLLCVRLVEGAVHG